MKIGVPSEIKAQESRVGLTPQSVKELVKDKHTSSNSKRCRYWCWIFK